MIKKPTTPYGGFAFRKDGRICPRFSKLHDDKRGQELGVAENFLRKGCEFLPDDATVEMLPEPDNDFLIRRGDGEIIAKVEATEIVMRNYCVELTENEYRTGWHQHMTIGADGKFYAIDPVKQREIIAERIRNKTARHYAKSAEGEFWLVVWSVTGHPLGSHWHQSKRVVSPSIEAARTWIAGQNNITFDKVFYFEMIVRPELVWPVVSLNTGESALS